MFFSLLLCAAVAVLGYLYLLRIHSYWKKRGLPYLEPAFIVGNTPNAITQKRNPYYDIQDIYKWVSFK